MPGTEMPTPHHQPSITLHPAFTGIGAIKRSNTGAAGECAPSSGAVCPGRPGEHSTRWPQRPQVPSRPGPGGSCRQSIVQEQRAGTHRGGHQLTRLLSDPWAQSSAAFYRKRERGFRLPSGRVEKQPLPTVWRGKQVRTCVTKMYAWGVSGCSPLKSQ